MDVCIHEVMDIFYNEEFGLVLENVMTDGKFSDSYEGRLLNPGHAIEAMWFMMDLASYKGDPGLAESAKDVSMSRAACFRCGRYWRDRCSGTGV